MLVVFGSLNADLIFDLDGLPAAGQTLTARGMTLEPGGKGANQAVAAARDGARVVMAGARGDDALGDVAMQGLREAGVDVSRVMAVPGATGCAAVCTDRDGRNLIVAGPGANAAVRAAAVEDALLGPGTVLVTQMEVGAGETAALIARARRAGARVVHNLAPARELAAEALRAVDVLVVNEDEAGWLAERLGVAEAGAAGLHRVLGVTVVCTLGAAGVAWAGPAGSGQVVGRAVAVVDSAGAGDCFVGVLAAGLERGATLDEAIGRANVAAALSCTRRGTQGSLPWAAETDAAA